MMVPMQLVFGLADGTIFVAARASRQERFEAWSAAEHLADDQPPQAAPQPQPR